MVFYLKEGVELHGLGNSYLQIISLKLNTGLIGYS